MSTTKRYEGPLTDGMVFVRRETTGSNHTSPWTYRAGQNARTVEDLRTLYWPVDAPAEKRTLAQGWRALTESDGSVYCFKGAAFVQRHADGTTGTKRARYCVEKENGTAACEACAPSMGVFAPPAPAKPVRPADDDRAAWEALLPKVLPRPNHDARHVFAVGEVWSIGYDSWKCVVLVTKEGGPSTIGICKQLAGNYRSFDAEFGVDNEEWIARATRLFPADAARAKPAEPKPAPAEKAKRCHFDTKHEGGAERIMFYAGHNQRFFACDACYLRSELGVAIAQDCKEPDEQDDKPPAHIGTVPQVFGDFVGVLGARGMRLDETRFEAGLRGRR